MGGFERGDDEDDYRPSTMSADDAELRDFLFDDEEGTEPDNSDLLFDDFASDFSDEDGYGDDGDEE